MISVGDLICYYFNNRKRMLFVIGIEKLSDANIRVLYLISSEGHESWIGHDKFSDQTQYENFWKNCTFTRIITLEKND